ncbi:MAG TPA: sigma-54 dependent transcriptional regulator [Candidatus Competibacteraceae bacterium]|nr:sigma-54 dependent transcriptional regulator [Candidatus Competibacteraceae bacterium]
MPGFSLPILLVDDEPPILRSTSVMLRAAGFRTVLTVEDGRQLPQMLASHEIGVVVLDLTMPHLTGSALLERIASEFPQVPVIIMTATNELETAVRCMQLGAFDYLLKPVEKNRLISAVARATEIRTLREEVQSLRASLLDSQLRQPEAFSEIVTRNRVMHAVFQYLEAIAPSPQPVLITGETGSGKELVARALHRLSGVSGRFVPVNVAGLDDNVFSDTLFGHKKGAFTGAERPREGLVAEAAQGTLFLDEIGDLALASQVKLLRLLQERKYYPLGSDQQRESSARVVVATNCDLAELCAQGRFRKDLYYRLHSHHVHLPPLRERRDDLPLLLNHFLDKAAEALGKRKPVVPTELYSLLRQYDFPGNVRELEAMVFDAMARVRGASLSLASFRSRIGQRQALAEDSGESATEALKELFPSRLPTIKEAEAFLVAEALRRADNNQGIAAAMLGLTRQALNKRLLRERRGS